MMKHVAFLFPALTITAASFALCSPSFAAPPQTANLTIENHQKLVTVKDGNGNWIFAQVMTTPNVKISTVASGKDVSQVILQDEAGRTLWSESLNTSFMGITLHGEWQDKAGAGCPQLPGDLNLKPFLPSFRDRSDRFRLEIIVGSDDQLVTSHIISAKHRIDITPINHGIVFKADDNKTVVILQPPTVAEAPASSAPATPN